MAASNFMQKLNSEFSKIMITEDFHKTVLKDKQDCRDEETDDEILSRAFDEVYPDWMTDLERRGKFHGDHQLEVYRGISVKDFKDIDFKNLGVFWTWHKAWAANYSDRNTQQPLHVLTALVSLDDIDLYETLRKIVWADVEESEREITLKPHARIQIIDPIKHEAMAKIQINARIHMAFKRILSRISSVVYHFTALGKACSILKDDAFKLGTGLGTSSEEKKGYYFLSTTRSPLGRYHRHNLSGVLFVLNGDLLNQRYRGHAIDYWGREFRKADPSSEMEDRIFTKDPEIKSAHKYIKEVHILFTKGHHTLDYAKKYLRDLLVLCKRKDIPYWIYLNEENFKTLNKSKGVSFKELDLTPKEPMYMSQRKSSNYLKPYLELYSKDKKEHLSDQATKILKRYINTFYSKDGLDNLKNEIHNMKSNPDDSLNEIVRILRKNKWTTLDQFWDFLQNKWKKIEKIGARTEIKPNLHPHSSVYRINQYKDMKL